MKSKFLRQIEFSLVYNRQKKLNRNGEALIQIRAYQEGVNRYFSTNIYIEPKNWDNRNKRIKTKAPGSFHQNKFIREQIERLEDFQYREINKHGFCLIESLTQEEFENPVYQSFIDFCHDELKRPAIKPNTIKRQKSWLKILQEFKDDILFEEITFTFLNKYNRYLHKRYSNNRTIHGHHRIMKTYINLAIKLDHIPPGTNPYDKFTLKLIEPDRVFLSKDELSRLKALNIPKELVHLEQIRDMFLFSCYTGLRISDLLTLAPIHIQQSKEGIEIHKRMEKTEKIIRHPISLLFRKRGAKYSDPEHLLLKALEAKPDIKDHYPIFKMRAQHYNRELKRLARMVGINKKITSHVARRTFATTMAPLVHPVVLKALLYHSKMETTMLYVKLAGKDIKQELEKINWD